MRERHRFMKGLFSWVGFKRVAVPYHRHARVAGTSKFSLWRLWNFALEGITGFSTVPLRAATYLGLATAAVAFVFGLWVIVKAALYGDRVAGWPTMMAVILFLGGVQLIALGLIGEYLGRLYEESKQRPLYLVDAWLASTVADSALQPTLGGQADDHVAPDAAVIDAIRLMAEKGIGAVLVMDGPRLVGILSERDYARKIVLRDRSSRDTAVAEIMTAQVVTVSSGEQVEHCLQLVTDFRIRHLPVVDGAQVLGVISIGDLVKSVIDAQRRELDQLQQYIVAG
ncbi:hypothetical protein G6F65_016110 [Rhizopus arrhizus]|nr:hypothetical protein G6F65_016110 [Rhizopus arrhizus]